MSRRHATMIVSPLAIEQAEVDILRLAVGDALEVAGMSDADDYKVHVTVVEVPRRPSLRPVPDLGGEAA